MLQLVKSAEHTPEEDTAVHAGGAGVAKWRMSATQNTKIDRTNPGKSLIVACNRKGFDPLKSARNHLSLWENKL
tara:strand:+ start:64 stop:285 length:222 start_codon:yes stop_codon:yes gene_type:complete